MEQIPFPDRFFYCVKAIHERYGDLETNEELDAIKRLGLYALHRQAVDGPCKEPAPYMWNVTARYKHSAWCELRTMPQIEAMFRYVQLATEPPVSGDAPLLGKGWEDGYRGLPPLTEEEIKAVGALDGKQLPTKKKEEEETKQQTNNNDDAKEKQEKEKKEDNSATVAAATNADEKETPTSTTAKEAVSTPTRGVVQVIVSGSDDTGEAPAVATFNELMMQLREYYDNLARYHSSSESNGKYTKSDSQLKAIIQTWTDASSSSPTDNSRGSTSTTLHTTTRLWDGLKVTYGFTREELTAALEQQQHDKKKITTTTTSNGKSPIPSTRPTPKSSQQQQHLNGSSAPVPPPPTKMAEMPTPPSFESELESVCGDVSAANVAALREEVATLRLALRHIDIDPCGPVVSALRQPEPEPDHSSTTHTTQHSNKRASHSLRLLRILNRTYVPTFLAHNRGVEEQAVTAFEQQCMEKEHNDRDTSSARSSTASEVSQNGTGNICALPEVHCVNVESPKPKQLPREWLKNGQSQYYGARKGGGGGGWFGVFW